MADSTNLQDSGIQIDRDSPSSGDRVGQMFYDTTAGALVRWNGSAFVSVASGGTATDILSQLQRVPTGGHASGGTGSFGWGTLGDWAVTAAATTLFFAANGAGTGGQMDTDGSLNDSALAGAGGLFTAANQRPTFVTLFALDSLADVRSFVGFSTASIGVTLQSDDPAAGYIGLQFSTGRADTNWQFSHKSSGGGTQQLVDTGIAPTASTALFLEVEYTTTTTATIRLRDETYSNILASANLTTEVPTGATGLTAGGGVSALAAAVKSFSTYNGMHYSKVLTS